MDTETCNCIVLLDTSKRKRLLVIFFVCLFVCFVCVCVCLFVFFFQIQMHMFLAMIYNANFICSFFLLIVIIIIINDFENMIQSTRLDGFVFKACFKSPYQYANNHRQIHFVCDIDVDNKNCIVS